MNLLTSSADLGLYVHVPFCERVCPYCDFAVEPVRRLDRALERRYVDLLLRELELTRAVLESRLSGRPLATVYLGGGTPSLLDPVSIERILAAAKGSFTGTPCEVTLELNPGIRECTQVEELRALGVTRLSVGLQSLHDSTLKRLGRAHRAADALKGLERCLRAGFPSLSVDLIFAAPEQTENELLEDLERIIDLGVAHVSAYELTIEPGTPFARAQARGQLTLPDESDAVRMSRLLRSRLAAAGYVQYEISNFAQPGHHSRHNERYWTRRDVLGLGPAAASLLGDRRFRNLGARRAWEKALAAGQLPIEECETLTESEARRETLYLGFRRLEGICRADYLRRFGAPPETHFGNEIRELRVLGLITERAGCLSLTERGILFADEVFLRFVGR